MTIGGRFPRALIQLIGMMDLQVLLFSMESQVYRSEKESDSER
ncbi:hypothetical protein ACM26V_08040 [Salipaludibacillus sp. HK11]